jgi:hypothetical protein
LPRPNRSLGGGLEILIGLERQTGHRHPNRDAGFANYRNLLAAMGKSVAEIDAGLAALEAEPT